MKQLPALGLVETRGLIGAIEAADAMCKAANVKLIGREKTNPALITVQIIGETAAVKTAVEAGAAAAARVGELVSTHVIPRPDLQLGMILSVSANGETTKSREQKVEPVALKKASVPEEATRKAPERAKTSAVLPNQPAPVKKVVNTFAVNDPQLIDMKVTDLRTLARATQDFPIKGRDISKANKEELLKFFAQIGRG